MEYSGFRSKRVHSEAKGFTSFQTPWYFVRSHWLFKKCLIPKMYLKSWIDNRIDLFSQYQACWWSSTVSYKDISMHVYDQVWSYIHAREWHVEGNSLQPGDTIWPHRSGSTLVQVMAWCLAAPSHYLNQRWLIINGCCDKLTFHILWWPCCLLSLFQANAGLDHGIC